MNVEFFGGPADGLRMVVPKKLEYFKMPMLDIPVDQLEASSDVPICLAVYRLMEGTYVYAGIER